MSVKMKTVITVRRTKSGEVVHVSVNTDPGRGIESTGVDPGTGSEVVQKKNDRLSLIVVDPGTGEGEVALRTCCLWAHPLLEVAIEAVPPEIELGVLHVLQLLLDYAWVQESEDRCLH